MEEILYYKMGSSCLPVIKYTNKVHVEPPHVHIRRQLEEYVLYFLLSGDMYLKEGKRDYHLEAGDMLILDPRLEHRGTKAAACTYFYIHFYQEQLEECHTTADTIKNEALARRFASLQTDECTIRNMPSDPLLLPKHLHISKPGVLLHMTELLEQITASHYNKLEYFRLQTGCLFMEFLLAASRELTDSFLLEGDSTFTARSTKIIYDIMTFFQSSYAGDITGCLIEQKYGCNYDYINRLFKKATGKHCWLI